MIDGHLRAETTPDQEVPVLVLDLNEEEADKLLVVLDPLARLAGADDDALGKLLAEVKTDNEALGEMLKGLAASVGLLPPIDVEEEWQGMPEFEQEDKTAFQSVHMHFKTQEAVDAFAKLTGQTITPKTRALWYPVADIETYADKRYADESGVPDLHHQQGALGNLPDGPDT